MSYLNPHTHVLDRRSKSLAEMTTEIRANNIEKGWRSAKGGPGDNTFGDYIALLHSEVSEALEAYRDHRLKDATAPETPRQTWLPKPEGVGSELADVLIRLLDMCDVFNLTPFDMDCELADVTPIPLAPGSFGDHLALLHFHAAQIVPTWRTVDQLLSTFLRALVTVAEVYGIDLTAEYERKIAYNRTRSFQHGGRTVSDAGRA